MRREKLVAQVPLYKDNGSFKVSFQTFDLAMLIEKMKNSHSWEKEGLDSVILLESPDKQIILTALHEGTEINSFQANDSVTFQIMEGQLMFQTPRESVTLEKGQMLTVHENINYSLTSWEETVFLLTIATNS
jgi:quercetin dioxygenase-like cupin family protein